VPFGGLGGKVANVLWDMAPSKLNPYYCNVCDQFAEENQGGAEIELSMLFADVRGSSALAEKMGNKEYSELINRFYQEVTGVLINEHALIEKLIGDEVTALFIPGWLGQDHAVKAVSAARKILEATGHKSRGGPWIPVGVGIHTGKAFVGAVGNKNGVTDIVALGDDVNIAARLASMAKPGEIVISRKAVAAARIIDNATVRSLNLKGRESPVEASVIDVAWEN